MAQLIVQFEGEPPVVHELTDGAITIGRESDNTIVIADASVSRRHAEILASDGPRTLRDLDSANGTAINGVPITKKLLKPGDVIHFGAAQATFVTKPPVQARADAPAPAVPARPSPLVVAVPPPLPPPVPAPPTPPVLISAETPPPVTVEAPPAPVEKLPLPTVREKLPTPEVPPAPVAKHSAPAAVEISPPAPTAPPSFKPKLPPVVKAPPPVETVPPPVLAKAPPPEAKPSLPVAKLPAPVAPVAPAPVVKLPVPAAPLAPLPVAKRPVPVAPVVPAPAARVPAPAAPASPKTPPPNAPAISTPAVAKTPLPVPVAVPPAVAKKPLLAPALPATPPPAASAPSVAAAKPPLPAPVSKHWRPDPPAASERLPKLEITKTSPPASATAKNLPLVPADLGQKSPASGSTSQPVPAFIGVPEREYAPDDSPSFFARHRVLVVGLALTLIAAAAATPFLLNRQPPPITTKASTAAPKPLIAGEESVPVATKRFWDQMQEVTRTGLRQAQSVPFQQFPLMSNGMYDFQLIDDNSLNALLDSLTTRSRGLAHIAEQIALLDKTNVDPALIAYGKKLGAHWQRAASLDSDAVNVVWAVHERRARPAATATPALESADVVAAESHAPGATPITMDHVTQLANGWLSQRDYFVKIGLEIDAGEKEIYRQLAGRYTDQFK